MSKFVDKGKNCLNNGNVKNVGGEVKFYILVF